MSQDEEKQFIKEEYRSASGYRPIAIALIVIFAFWLVVGIIYLK